MMEPQAIGPQGTMAVRQDPGGGAIGVWQAGEMAGSLVIGKANAYGWAELNARGFEKAEPFYTKLFGWGTKKSPMGEGQGEYTEFQVNGESIAGGMEMNPMVPAQVPSYCLAHLTLPSLANEPNKAAPPAP